MANSELYGKTFKIPSNILNNIQKQLVLHPNHDGVKRAKNLLKGKTISYQLLKRLKNFFDYFNPNEDDKVKFELAGGSDMKDFVERILNSNRDAVERSKEVKRDLTTNHELGLKHQKTPRLNEDVDGVSDFRENALAIIFNKDNKILLLKRATVKNGWGNDKWALVGGAVDENEKPIDACKREIYEETLLRVNELNQRFTLQRSPDSVEHLFVGRHKGDDDDVVLNEDENIRYDWFSFPEIKHLDGVPNLLDYISIGIKNYH